MQLNVKQMSGLVKDLVSTWSKVRSFTDQQQIHLRIFKAEIRAHVVETRR